MNIANKVSIFRILSIPFFVACVIFYSPQRDYLRIAGFYIFCLAMASDAVDGLVARLGKQVTKAGAIIDPLADKLLLISSFICMSFRADMPKGIHIPLWFVFVALSRDIIILIGATLILLIKQDINIKPSALGKLTTFFQMLTVVSVILQFDYSYVVWWSAAVLTVLSGADYIKKGFGVLYVNDINKNNLKPVR